MAQVKLQYWYDDLSEQRTIFMLGELKAQLRIDHDNDDLMLARYLSTCVNRAYSYTNNLQLFFPANAADQQFGAKVAKLTPTDPQIFSMSTAQFTPDVRTALYEGVRLMLEAPGTDPIKAMAPYLDRWRVWSFGHG